MANTDTLDSKVEALRQTMAAHLPTKWNGVLVWFDPGGQSSGTGRLRIPRGELVTMSEARQKFERLLALRPPWLNVSCLGLIDGDLLIAVEVATGADRQSRDGIATSFNYSAPPRAVVAANWDVTAVVDIV